PGVFEAIVHHHWKQIDFFSDNFSARFDLPPYQYKMIRSIDFYNYVLEKAKGKPNIHFKNAAVKAVVNNNENSTASVWADEETYTADHIFNSITLQEHGLNTEKKNNNQYHLLQHFKGWLIETPSSKFDECIATFMDFRVSQQFGTTFMYMLPVARNKALVEYTLFTENLLEQQEYDTALKEYISVYLKLENYTITEQEFGVIPMTNVPFSKGAGKVVNIGTAGGQTKASSGFTFSFIQKHSDAIINALVNDKDPHTAITFTKRRFNLYDSVLLNILQKKKMGGDTIFAALFKKNPPQRVLKFLDNETNFSEELKIMSSVPTTVFFPAAISELLS
ncbi:MAG: lycopene cyclase family protein, partial [Panacibacter sp.]